MDSEINQMFCAGEWLSFLDQVRKVGTVARLRQVRIAVPQPLLLTQPGYGNTTAVRLLTKALKEEKLLVFRGEEEYFEWEIRSNEEEPVKKCLARIEEAAGFYDHFSGVMAIDLTNYTLLAELDDTLFAMIRDLRKHIVFCIMLSDKLPEPQLMRFERRIGKFFPTVTVKLAPNRETLSRFAIAEIQAAKLSLGCAEEAPVFQDFLTACSGDGFRGVQLAVSQLVWLKLQDENSLMVSQEDLHHYCSLLGMNNRPVDREKRLIGFGAYDQR